MITAEELLIAGKSKGLDDWIVKEPRELRRRYKERVQKTAMEKIEELYKSIGEHKWTVDEISLETGINRATCDKRLNYLRSVGRLTREGKQPYVWSRTTKGETK